MDGGPGSISRTVSQAGTAESHEDAVSGTAESARNLTSEADFEESTSIMETRELATVTANSGTLSGLDKWVAAPLGASEHEKVNSPRTQWPSGSSTEIFVSFASFPRSGLHHAPVIRPAANTP